MSPDKNLLLAMLAGELDDARADLEKLGSVLCSNPALVSAHLEELQGLDLIGQRCASIAAILRSQDMYSATRDATLESLSERFATITATWDRYPSA